VQRTKAAVKTISEMVNSDLNSAKDHKTTEKPLKKTDFLNKVPVKKLKKVNL
jgi:hypothetical protein